METMGDARLPPRRRRLAAVLACVVALAGICALSGRCAAPSGGQGAGQTPTASSLGEGGTPDGGVGGQADPDLAHRLTVPSVCEGARLVETAGSGMGIRATWGVGLPVDDAARSVLEGYERDEGIHLGRAEYIDLYGRVWSCVVSSRDGWSETVLVDGRGSDDDASCKVTVIRLATSSGADGGQGVDGAVEAAVASGLAAAADVGRGE